MQIDELKRICMSVSPFLCSQL